MARFILTIEASTDLTAGASPLLDVLVDGAVTSSAMITAQTGFGSDILVFTLDFDDSVQDFPSSLQFRFNGTSGDGDETVTIEAVRINGQALNVAGDLTATLLSQGQTLGLVAPVAHDHLFGRADPALGDFGATTINGTGGVDDIEGTTGADIIDGGASDDRIAGLDDDDAINGGAGADTLYGQAGNDAILGGTGDDKIFGNDGDDLIHGQGDNDRLFGEAGNDVINGGAGNDVLFAGDGDDVLYGEAGDDRLIGQRGTNSMYGDGGNDFLIGGNGADTMFGGDDNDTIYGGRGDDIINGDDGIDLMRGNDGVDIINGGNGADTGYGGNGNDVLAGGAGADTLYGEAGNDEIRGHGLDAATIETILTANPLVSYNEASNSFYQYVATGLTWAVADAAAQATLLSGQAGHLIAITSQAENDFAFSLTGGAETWIGASDATTEGTWLWSTGPETSIHFWQGDGSGSAVNGLYNNWQGGDPNNNPGGDADAAILNASGQWFDRPDTQLHGYIIEWDAALFSEDNAADILYGGAGNDSLYGFGGDDQLFGEADNDALIGGTGNDTLVGGAGSDSILGGDGNDNFQLANGDFTAGEVLSGGSGTDTITLTNATTIDFATGTTTSIELLTGSTGNDTVTMAADKFVEFTTIDLAGGTDTMNVQAAGDISASGLPTTLNIETGNLTGTGADDSITLTGAQLDAIISGTGTINLGGGAADTINLTSTSADLNTLGNTDASIQGVETISVTAAAAPVTVLLLGQTEDITITGGNFNDILATGAGDDVINAGTGDDIIAGLDGVDILDAGAGNDTIVLINGNFAAGESLTGGTGTDTLLLNNATTVDLSTGTLATLELFTGSGGNDNVTMTALQFVGFTTIDLAAGAADVMNVQAAGDISASALPVTSNIETGNLTGTGGNDIITLTGAQLDAIISGAGIISMGGGGADTINITSNSADLNTLGATNGSITGLEIISAATAAAGVTINMAGQTEGFTITGSGSADTITSGTGADTIDAGGGDDTIQLANGDFAAGESLTGGAGTDTITLTNATTIDLATGTTATIEIFNGSAGNDIVTMAADKFVEFTTIDLAGGAADVMNVQAAGDISASGLPTTSNIETGNLTGTAGNDSITLTGAQLDSIISGSGTIDLAGGASDTINITTTSADLNALGATDGDIAGVETISASTAVAAVTIDMNGQTEAFTLTGGAGGDTLTGGSGNDTFNGNNGADTIYGALGDDTLNGDGGNDILYGDDAPQIVSTVISTEDFEAGATGWSNNTTTNGGANFTNFLGRFAGGNSTENIFKTYNLSGTQSTVTITFDFYEIDSWNTEPFLVFIDGNQIFSQNFDYQTIDNPSGGTNGTTTWSVVSQTPGLQDLGFTTWNDQIFTYTLEVTTTANTIRLGFAEDLNSAVTNEALGIDNVVITENVVISPPGGNDTLNGDAGNDELYGRDGNDILNGGDNDDELYGEDGNDTLNGGNGIDDLQGGAGDDTSNGGAGNDTILDAFGQNTMNGDGGNDTLDARVDSLSASDLQDLIDGILSENAGLSYNAATNNFYQFQNNAVTWATARTQAAALQLEGVNGHLVTITSQAENDFVQGLMSAGQSTWLGGSDLAVEGVWRWVEGPETGLQFWQGGAGGTTTNGLYANWTATEPNNDGAPSYAIRMQQSNGLWTDRDGNAFNYTYVAEWDGDQILGIRASGGSSQENMTMNGGAGNDTIYGGSGDDTIHGDADDDILYGRDGLDTLYGDGGADTFVFERAYAFNDIDVLQSYNQNENDIIDISDVLTGLGVNAGNIANFVQITSGNGVRVDFTGTGTFGAATQIASFSGTTSVSDAATMLTNGDLVI